MKDRQSENRRLRAKAQGIARTALVALHLDQYRDLYAKAIKEVYAQRHDKKFDNPEKA